MAHQYMPKILDKPHKNPPPPSYILNVQSLMLRPVASVPCQEYIKYKIPTHTPAFLSSNSILFYFLSQRSYLPFVNLYCIYFVVLISEAYSEPCQTSKMGFFCKNS